MKPTFALETLGCKVNQYESSFFHEALLQAGYERTSFRERADLYLVHSCTVTTRASFQTRQLLRRAHRLHPHAFIAALGCDAQIEGDRLVRERLATHILGTQEKFALLHWLAHAGTFETPVYVVGNCRQTDGCRSLPVSHMASGRTRAFLKVQDGCDAFCSYCVVPFSRGRSRSLAPRDILVQLERFRLAGYREVVLSGIHLGQWGKDLHPGWELVDLLHAVARHGAPERLRLSSLETLEWTGRLLSALPAWPWVCPHYHVPLQSGDHQILARMHRTYTPRQFTEAIWALHEISPTAAIGCDVIAGFPGEGENHFRHTMELLESLPVSYLHVFPFSPRPGTVAAGMTGRISAVEMKRRAAALRQLGQEKRLAFERRFLGQTLRLLVEGQSPHDPLRVTGTTANYLRVLCSSRRPVAAGTFASVQIEVCHADGVEGKIVAIHG
jgi:threonylcarbamoyladenosine tRNA methylthiotransferase MtaB